MKIIFKVDKSVQLILNQEAFTRELRLIGREISRRTKALIQKDLMNVSKPGESPLGKTGNLARMIRVRVKNNSVQVIDLAKYALALEAGSHGPGKRDMEARPYLSRVLDAMKADIERRLIRAINEGITTQ